MDDKFNKNKNNNSDEGSADSGNLKHGDEQRIIIKTGAYSEIEIVDEKTEHNDAPAKIDSHNLGPDMGLAKTENILLEPDAIKEKKGEASNRYKARIANFLSGLDKEKNLKAEYKGEVNINDVKSDREPFEERLKQYTKHADELEKTIENNANKNAVVRRILAKYEEKIERDPKLAEKLDTKAEVIAKVGHVPSSQMSHVEKLIEKAKDILGKGPLGSK